MNRKNLLFIGIALIVTMVPFSLAKQIIIPICPKSIVVSERLNKLPNGWQSFPVAADNFLTAISLYSEHPKEQANLKPDFINKSTAKWTVSPDDVLYVMCEYHQTAVRLIKRLPAKITSCEVSYNQEVMSDRGPIPEQFKCYNDEK